MGFLVDLVFGKDLRKAVNQTKSVRINGVNFVLKKIDPFAYLEGAKILKSSYEVYKTAPEKMATDLSDPSTNKIKSHYVDVFMAGVVKPALSRKDGLEEIFVEDLLKDYSLCNKLYEEIMTFTYGKKKLLTSLGRN